MWTARKTRKKGTALLAAMLMALTLTACKDTAHENQVAYKTIGINAMADDDYAGAIDAFDKALEQAVGVVGSEEVDICYYKAQAQYESGDTEGALSTYNALLDFDDNLPQAHFLRGNLYLDQGDLTSALSDYKDAVRQSDKDLTLYITICENLTNSGCETEGTEFLTQATEISGNSAADQALRGRAYYLLGRYDEAEGELKKAVEGGDLDAQLYLAQLLNGTGDTEGAKSLFESYLAEKGDDADALNALGCMSMQNGNYTEALTFFEQALSSAEESGVDPQAIMRNRILAYEYNGQFAEAKTAMIEYAEDYELDEELQREYTFLETR